MAHSNDRASTSHADIPEDNDYIMSSDDSGQVFTPPPHIAARFSRPSGLRRRSSAASSRRNSLSSTQSHHSQRSHRSYHGPQSNHIAQHLRRASIIESRKARLADRAIHAEQVRLRAAAVKAAPRASNSEGRALAAQQARDKYLAQVAASCAEEVRRAKKIAGEMKEKREADLRKREEDMEEKLAEAERRRAEYQRNGKKPRTMSTPRLDPPTPKASAPSYEKSVRYIQTIWRIRQRRLHVQEFLQLGLSVEGVRDTTFESVTALLSQERVLNSASKILRLCGVPICDDGTIGDTSTVRKFLSAFLILGHPAHVFSNNGDQEQDVMTKSKDLLVSFERIVSNLGPSNQYKPSQSMKQVLSDMYRSFVSALSAWTARDSTIMVSTMVAQYVELEMIWRKIKEESEEVVKEEYRKGIRDNQINIFAKIRRLAGPEKAKNMIAQAVRVAFRASAKKPLGDIRPRTAVSSSHSPAVPSSELSTAIEEKLEAFSSNDTSLHMKHADRVSSITKPPSLLPDNRVLVHELAIDKRYRIDPSETIEAGNRRAIVRSMFDTMKADIEDGNGSQWTLLMANTIRTKLTLHLSSKSPLRTPILETLDETLIKRELEHGSFSYERFFSFINAVLPQMCSPARDAEVKALADDESADYVSRMARLMHIIDLMTVDHTNFSIASSAPVLIKEASGYERRRFASDLDKGIISLERTETWWRTAKEKVAAEASRRNPEGVNHPGNRLTLEKIYMQGLTDLAISTVDLVATELPETLSLDEKRIKRMRADTLQMVGVGAILLTAKNLLKRDVRTQWKAAAAAVASILIEVHDSSIEDCVNRILSILASAQTIPPNLAPTLSAMVLRVATQVHSKIVTDPVMRLLFQRLKSHIFLRLSATSASDRVRLASNASESLASSGLPEFVNRVGGLVDELGRVGSVDRDAHGEWYDSIAQKIGRE